MHEMRTSHYRSKRVNTRLVHACSYTFPFASGFQKKNTNGLRIWPGTTELRISANIASFIETCQTFYKPRGDHSGKGWKRVNTIKQQWNITHPACEGVGFKSLLSGSEQSLERVLPASTSILV